MGKITVFTLDDCPYSTKAKELLTSKGAQFEEISLSKHPEWIGHMFILTKGRRSVPEIFFNDVLIGGLEELQKLDESNKLDSLVKECLEAPTPNFPPTLRKPTGEELIQVIPEKVRQNCQKAFDAANSKFTEILGRPIANLMVVMDTPEELVVVCSAGPATGTFPVGVSGPPGKPENHDVSWCQVALEKKSTLFVNSPVQVPGCENNLDVQFGYSFYLGTPWFVRQMKGTVVALEKESDVLKEEHKPIVEGLRDTFQKDLEEYLDTNEIL